MRLFFLREQLIRSSEQLVLVNTKKGVFRPCVDLSLTANSIKRKAVLLHSSVFKRISVHYFIHSRAETRGKQPEIRGRRPYAMG